MKFRIKGKLIDIRPISVKRQMATKTKKDGSTYKVALNHSTAIYPIGENKVVRTMFVGSYKGHNRRLKAFWNGL